MVDDDSKKKRDGTLGEKEIHPAAQIAFTYIKRVPVADLFIYLEAFASTALSGNRLSQVCYDTLDRIMNGKPVGERYVLGLAWAIRDMQEKGKWGEKKIAN